MLQEQLANHMQKYKFGKKKKRAAAFQHRHYSGKHFCFFIDPY